MPTKREDEIKKEAKQILDKFAKALSKVKETPDFYVEREEDRRKEGDGSKGEKEFIDGVFENAPATKGKCFLAEKGGWK